MIGNACTRPRAGVTLRVSRNLDAVLLSDWIISMPLMAGDFAAYNSRAGVTLRVSRNLDTGSFRLDSQYACYGYGDSVAFTASWCPFASLSEL